MTGPGRIEKTVFISYRRATGSVWALAIAKELTHHGYDVFFDFTSIASGDFEQVILGNIEARAHFLVLLTPSALERIHEPGDWLRREIETALEHRRNIVPLMLEGFDFATPSIRNNLTGSIASLTRYNGLTVPVEYFDEAMSRLRSRHLNVPVDAVLHSPSILAREVASEQRAASEAAPEVAKVDLRAEQWFERGFEAADPATQVFYFTQAIRLKPAFARAYVNRAAAHLDRREFQAALRDLNEAILLDPGLAVAYYNRGLAHTTAGDLDAALRDYTEAIRLEPDYAWAYGNRAAIYSKQGQFALALKDFGEAERLRPDNHRTYHGRAVLYSSRGDYSAAIADYQKYIALGGGNELGGEAQAEGKIAELRRKLGGQNAPGDEDRSAQSSSTAPERGH